MFIRQNDTGLISVAPAVSISDGFTAVTSLTLSGADSARARLGDDSTVDISGYTWAAIANMDGAYNLTLQTGVSDTVGPLDILIEDVSLVLPIWQRYYIVEETVFDAIYATSALGFSATASITGAVPASTTKPPATPTEREMLEYLYWRLVYGKIAISATEETVLADDGSTELYTKAITDAGGVVTYAESVAGV